jgi:hypothetical protein
MPAKTASELHVIRGGLTIEDDFRAAVARDLVQCLPRSRRDDPARCFHGQHLDDLVHWLRQYEREPWTEETVRQARERPNLIAYGSDWIAHHFGTRKHRHGWAVMARMIGMLTLAALRGADVLAGRKPRVGYGRVSGPAVAFICDRLADIVVDDMPSHENLLRTLERAAPKPPQVPRRRRRKARKVAIA